MNEVSEALREAAWGRSTWDEACRRLAAALPGSSSSIVNYDLPRQSINAAFQHGIDPQYLDSYQAYYFSINPWVDFWAAASSGQVNVSQRDYPAAIFRGSEFYADWLAPQRTMEAAVGMRVDADPHNTIHVAWHYGLAQAPAYDDAGATVLKGLKRGIVDAVRDTSLLRDALEGGVRLGALIERIDGAALLVDRDRRVREANSEAVAASARGDVIHASGNFLALRDAAAHRWMEETVARLADAEPVEATSMVFSSGDKIFRATATLAPNYEGSASTLLIPLPPLVLVVIRFLVGVSMRVDESALRLAFGLSKAEIRLCAVLMNGHSLAEAARMLEISDGTVRQRVKEIFHKTHTHRQGELIATLGRFCIPE